MTYSPALLLRDPVKVVLRNGEVFMVRDSFDALTVRLASDGEESACKCCAFECEVEVTISVTFCGVTSTFTMPIPGIGNFEDPLPGEEDFLLVGADITCGPCGWYLTITICGYCEETDLFVSEGYTAEIPFASSEETPGDGYCPESGEVDLECFGDQFGIPCVTTTTATIA